MRLATFNVLHGRPVVDGRPRPFPHGAADAPFAEAITALDADVLALQEVDRLQERSGWVDQAAVAARVMGAKDWRYASSLHGSSVLDPDVPGLRVYGVGDEGAPSHGIALLSRLPVREWRARRFASAPLRLPLRVAGRPGLSLVRDQPRLALAAVVEGERGLFTVVAAHLSFVPGWNVRQLVALDRWTAELPAPRLLLGDLNLIGALPSLLLGRGWRDLARVPTYPSHRPAVQFDHVLATGVTRAAVRDACAPSTPISDHRPLLVDLDSYG